MSLVIAKPEPAAVLFVGLNCVELSDEPVGAVCRVHSLDSTIRSGNFPGLFWTQRDGTCRTVDLSVQDMRFFELTSDVEGELERSSERILTPRPADTRTRLVQDTVGSQLVWAPGLTGVAPDARSPFVISAAPMRVNCEDCVIECDYLRLCDDPGHWARCDELRVLRELTRGRYGDALNADVGALSFRSHDWMGVELDRGEPRCWGLVGLGERVGERRFKALVVLPSAGSVHLNVGDRLVRKCLASITNLETGELEPREYKRSFGVVLSVGHG